MAQVQELEKRVEELTRMIQNLAPKNNPLDANVTPPQVLSSYGALSSPSAKTQRITVPFQRHIYNLSSIDEGLKTLDLASLEHITKIIAPYRSAEFLKLECVLSPNHGAIANPFTVECLWTTQNVTLTAKELPDTFGSQTLVIGGISQQMPHSVVSCNLRSINPRIKDSVNYNDTPRLYLRFTPNQKLRKEYMTKNSLGVEVLDETKKKYKTCRVYIRGLLCMHSLMIGSEGVDEE